VKPTVWRDAIRDERSLDPMATLVAHTLSTFMNGHGECWPAKETIQEGAKLSSVRTVDRAVLRLEAAGYLTVRRTKGGKASTNRYVAVTPHPSAGYGSRNPASDDTKPRISRRYTPYRETGESAESAESVTSARSLGVRASLAITETCAGCGTVFETSSDVAETLCGGCGNGKPSVRTG
jgi:hypothetical protein